MTDCAAMTQKIRNNLTDDSDENKKAKGRKMCHKTKT